MSSTNRSKARDAHVSDYYVTPVDSIVLFLNDFKRCEEINESASILDPCAGGDDRFPMSYPEALRQVGFTGPIETIDIREDSQANIKGNYLEMDCKGKYDLIITNPPFNHALEIIQKALDDVKDGGYVVMLLRLNFFGSQARKTFFDQYLPKYSFVHCKRLKFTNTGGTDSIEYMHTVWQKNYYPEFTKLKII